MEFRPVLFMLLVTKKALQISLVNYQKGTGFCCFPLFTTVEFMEWIYSSSHSSVFCQNIGKHGKTVPLWQSTAHVLEAPLVTGSRNICFMQYFCSYRVINTKMCIHSILARNPYDSQSSTDQTQVEKLPHLSFNKWGFFFLEFQSFFQMLNFNLRSPTFNPLTLLQMWTCRGKKRDNIFQNCGDS